LSVVTLEGVGHYYGDLCIFRNISVTIDRDKRIGLIGRNGSGKTTLLDIISGKLSPKEGTVNRMRNSSISYLSQSMQINSDSPLLEFVLSSYKHLNVVTLKLRELEAEISKNPSDSNLKLLNKYQEEYLALDGFNLEFRAKIILQRLAFPEDTWHRGVNSFSGGEKTRIQLAAILLQPSDLLLLDEPTNHLDLKMREWLIKYLTSLSIPYIIVSHDRYFLDKTTTTTLSIENKSIVGYGGCYSLYEKEYLERQEQLYKQYQAQQDWISNTEDFIKRNIAGQKTKQAKSRLKALERVKKIELPKQNKNIRLSFETKNRSGNIVYAFEDVAFGFPDKTLAKNINGHILYQDRIAILGDNGCGKTTFLQLLLGEKKPLTGHLQRGASLSIGYYDQLHLSLNDGLTVRETIVNEHVEWTNHQTISYLAKFGFVGDDLEKMVQLLSGGEKARLYLSLLIARHPNVLIMDEPTNHLDIFLIESLEQALEEYEGTLIFVSHDRFFIENIANRFWVFQNKEIVETLNWEELLLTQEDKPVKQKKQPTVQKEKDKKINPILLDIKLKKIDELRTSIEDKRKELSGLEMLYLKKEILKNAEKIRTINQQIDHLREDIKTLQNEMSVLEDDYLNSVYQD